MKQHEREFFIYKIRSGKSFLNENIVIYPSTIEQNIQACMIYDKTYDQALNDDVMTEDEMFEWMIEHGLWSYEDEQKIKGLQKDIERLKIEIYNARNNKNLAQQIRKYIRRGENQLNNQLHNKNIYYQNTCEGFANTEKISWLIENTTYKNNKLYNFENFTLSDIIHQWQMSNMSESQCRELARNEPWKSLWAIKDKANIKLFQNSDDYELTYNQKSLLIWSQMYDNIQESIDCPTKEVIEDDDMLDGWFIIQAKKRDQEKAETEFENNTNSKIKNSSEIFVVTRSTEDKNRVDNMNNTHAQMIKQQRADVIKKKGVAQQHDFQDEILRIKSKQTEMYKGKFKGGK